LPMKAAQDIRLYLTLSAGVVAVSFAAIFIRVAEAPSIVVAAYRLSLASLIVAPIGLLRRCGEIRSLDRKDLGFAVVSGLFLTLHFAFWIASLSYTTVASSVVFVATSALFAGIAARLLGQDRVSRTMFVGIAVAVVGGMIIGWEDVVLGGRALWGDFLALLGAVMAAGYWVAGRRLRATVSLLAYVSVVYSIAAVGALALCTATWQSLAGYSTVTYLMFVLLAVGPQIIGHSSFNWALRHLSAPVVGVTTLGEPVGSTILACLILRETPTLVKISGGALILGGIYFSLREERVQRRDSLENGVQPLA
jgi:drug/metabolite transporter (DMT)-like permease